MASRTSLPSLSALILRNSAFGASNSLRIYLSLRKVLLNEGLSQVDDLSPLIKLQNLEMLDRWNIPHSTSRLPLTRCIKLKKLRCSSKAKSIYELKEKRPDLDIRHW